MSVFNNLVTTNFFLLFMVISAFFFSIFESVSHITLKSSKTALDLVVFFRAEKPSYYPGPIREMGSHNKVKFPLFYEAREMLFYFPFNRCWFLLVPYDIPHGFIEFPVEQN
jgi:hypothetical protein